MKQVKDLSQIPSETMHFQRADVALYAKANSPETANIEALTRAIYEGEIRIIGDYSCVNHLGKYPSDTAPELEAKTPVPVKLWTSYEADAMTARHEVTVAEDKRIKIYVCHFKSDYAPTDNARPLVTQRIYFAGF